MSPALARIKRQVRAAVDACGGVDGAAATAERGRSVAGDWHNLNHRAFPPLDCALALDEVAVARGLTPAILTALAAELGHVAIRLPDCGAGEDALTRAMVEASAEFGDVARALCEATRDGEIKAREADGVVVQIDEAMAALVRMRAVLANPAAEARPGITRTGSAH
ncbi:hypothetical protein B0I00_1874 [Novosphingobium kunmingense]|uniref:Phage regulatory protein CII n=1 Tax=Novosphingobium kunmingense TaxID=1211806 RepID=A0A2N0HL82_9SPHN|nr:phage regulatory CII family protein [Novosphingobium kunmingense]PKB19635.1 hypothetical protein B0I00_1874 [Novosphingobium kunmingense]